MCGTEPSPTVTRERPPCFIPFFYMTSRLLNLTTQGGTPLSLGSCARCQGLIVSLLTCLWLRRVSFIATHMSSRIWGTCPFRVFTRLSVLSFISRLIEDNRENAFQVGCPNIPVFCSILKRLHDCHRYSADPFGALADIKTIIEKAIRQTVREAPLPFAPARCGRLSFFFPFVPTVAFANVFSMFPVFLTLRPSAPVFCCHRDSLTRRGLALAQEAARDAASSSPHLSI